MCSILPSQLNGYEEETHAVQNLLIGNAYFHEA